MTAAVVIFDDISERIDLEKHLQEIERFSTIGETAAMVGHDLRNPLQVIVGELSLARERLKKFQLSEGKSDFEETLESIRSQVLYMNKIVSDLQDYSRPIDPKLADTNLQVLIRRTLKEVQVPGNVVVVDQVPTELVVTIDPSLMQRVFTNLFNNAVEAMPHGGELTVNASLKDRSLFVEVNDTGVGIADENLERVFQPLFTTKPRGQGFGLAVCKRIIEAHKGRIGFSSKVGKGTKFTLEVPQMSSRRSISV